MLICGDCNARNNDGEQFCSNCGAYLVWQQTPAEAEEKRPTRTTGSGTGRSPEVTTAQLPIVYGPPGTPARGPSVTGSGDRQSPVQPDGPTPGPPITGRARVSAPGSFGATATANAQPHGEVLEERQPRQAAGRPPREPEPHPRRDEAPRSPGGLTCRRCGADNKPEGSFCRQCGASLKEAVVVPVPPWWRQLLGRSKPAALPAGTRPQWRKQKRFPAGAVSVLTVLGLFGGVAYLGRHVITAAVMRAVDEIWEKPVSARTMKALNFAPGREPELALDGSAVRSWASNGADDAGVAYLEADFDTPFRLTYVIINGGASSVKQDFDKERRPAKVEIIAARDDGSRSSLTVDLSDVSAPQNFYFGADQITTVRLNILESKGPAGARVSVAEVQFAGR
ncbi:ribosomal protein L40E [Arthrobacter sp. V4I6]|uniref:NADase-type glycan-binding domain-containing protein n=1 Tax=unclassified Arthrobacter TaxID=235627 RepID=UPI0027883236|nr:MULTISPECIES: hypothetical protein [unclassified Arthrobacter]MDQ0821171.1 ribosomal protein L40E [Arthrobacter sp. V1I7]MDQ0855434.1 ribosomal protein L40E [Arthrobacter sp. V4I6]